ncbi:hypothetical protein PCANC_23084 [Puccinia coronata f. sp. avenae]|uniref:Uncharacterized protein n=1 Tax=Puccinia coronata f. sp. avenae TaxID=200324 RepID=A0A2N5U7L2_9BASI|nr:hypothetical protein PCANC_23084 [Puccinia coronata f. sp. avenae]
MSNSRLRARVLQIDDSYLSRERPQVKISIPQDIDFNDHILSSVDMIEFHQDYAHIFLADGVQLADACNHQLVQTNGNSDNDQIIPLPNPWRIKASGRIICHVPITLYADDTSGNMSKQFNKHIYFFFTLSGLPSNLSNQEYNCQFLSTSNVASVLEMSEQIIAYLK